MMVLGGAQNGTTDTCCFDAGFGPTQVSCPRPNDECPLNGHTDCNGGCLYEVRHSRHSLQKSPRSLDNLTKLV